MAHITFVSTYAPVRCGIASFTGDLGTVVGDHEVVALDPTDGPKTYPPVVRDRIRRDVRADYASAARAIDARSTGVVSLQHEYGIWGGRDGAFVLDFVRALETPVVATLHTVLERPTMSQRESLTGLVQATAATVVMSKSAARLLTRTYAIDPRRLSVIPHGVPDLPLVEPDTVKPALGLEGRTVVLSFGLLGPGKGYESVIAALPALVAADPSAIYVVVGATHPAMLRREGEAYRESLQSLAARLGVSDHVRFIGRFVEQAELATWLKAADIFVTPYPNLEQIVSGTLSYAMGAGKAIVSTPYAYANERLADGRGRLVAPGSIPDLADALIELARHPEARRTLGKRAHAYSRGMRWPEVGAAYRALFDRVSRPADAIGAHRAPPTSRTGDAPPRRRSAVGVARD